MKPDASHLPGLELANALFSEDGNPRVYGEKLSSALALSRAANERESRLEAPVDYAQPLVPQDPALDADGAPKDYVQPTGPVVHPVKTISVWAKLCIGLIGFMGVKGIYPSLFNMDDSIPVLILSWIGGLFWLFVFVYSLVGVCKDVTAFVRKKSALIRKSKNDKAVRTPD